MATKKGIKKSSTKAAKMNLEYIQPESEVKSSNSGIWSNIKLFFVTILICLMVFAAGYIYLWIQNFRNQQAEGKAAIIRAEQLEIESQDLSLVRVKVQEQVSSCNALIAGGSGDFSLFEYCKRFVEWSRSLPQSVVK